MKAIALSEGLYSVDHSKVFTPFDPNKDDIKERPTGSAVLGVHPFVVITDDDIVLLDGGLGRKIDGQWQMFQNLQANNISAGDVTKVLISHFHKDHIGGLAHIDETGNFQFNFPNAIYYYQQRELDYALASTSPSFNQDLLRGFQQQERTIPLLEDQGSIGENITYIVTGGHSPFHQVFWFREDGKTIFYGGDEAPQLFQLTHHINAKYDYDGKKAMEWRKKWLEEGKNEDWTFLFYHDVKYPILNLHD